MIDNIIISSNEFLDFNSNRNLVIDSRPAESMYIGHIKNMKLKRSLNGSVICGSIAKYRNGENITLLRRTDIEETMAQLQDDLKINFDNAIIRSVEIGTNLILKDSISKYLQCLGNPNNAKIKKVQTSGMYGLESICYRTKTGGSEFSLYNKTQEMIDNHNENKIPQLFQNENILRLELRLKKRQALKTIFNKDLKPFDLCKKEVLNELKSRFKEYYNSIQKTKSNVYIDMSESITPAKLQELMAMAFLQEHFEEFENILGIGKEKGFLNKNAIDRLKAKNKAIKQYSSSNELVVELNEKLRINGF